MNERGSLRSRLLPTRTSRITFACNICGNLNTRFPRAKLQREVPSCRRCGSTVRWRAVVRLLSLELFGKSLVLADFPRRNDVIGLGMSDWPGYADLLAAKLNYVNTFYHQEPRLDIASVDESFDGRFDFVISSDVFEHVPPPVSRAFSGMFRLLKPNGLVVFTVPWVKAPATAEHFPSLHDYEILRENGGTYLRNVTREGEVERFDDLVFHGGDGATLEMRLFAERDLLERFTAAGFTDARVRADTDESVGVIWFEDWSLPLTARRPASA